MHVGFVRLVFEDSLVVDVGEEVGGFEVGFEVFGVPEVLRGDESRLYKGGPGVGAQERLRATAEEVRGGAGLEGGDAVVLGAEG